ncbi:MAG: tetratricopeptide repeat protein [Rhodanobacteraceae bacterium]|nr:MAG: tetratricopeptide repeat protein [Rhodanobacteraceae bacterium]
MNVAPNILYEFGPFRIDPDRGLVLRDGQPLAITPKAFEVLLALVRRNHEVVSKDELMQAVWPDRVVEEANLSQCIFVLRKLLGDTHDTRRYIVTLPGQGYRFAEQVRTVAPDEPESKEPGPSQAPAGIADAAVEPPAESGARPSARKWALAAIGALIIVVVLLGAGYFIHRHMSPVQESATSIPAKSIAVLPFENLSNDKNNAYFVAGMQDLILTRLADIGDLKVVARTATENYGSHPDDLKAIAQRLGVTTLLEGSVQKAGNEVLINVQLIDASTGSHIWAQSYQRTLDNIFGVEGEVATKVAGALDAKLTTAETEAVTRVATHNPQAYDDYLRGNYFDNQANQGAWMSFIPRAIAAYQKAVAEDPTYAAAWAGLSNARSDAYFGGLDRSEANMRAAAAAAQRALALDPKSADAHLAMSGVERFLDHDLVASRDQARQAAELQPNDAGAWTDLAIESDNIDDENMARKALKRAIALDPTASFPEYYLGVMRANRGDYTGGRQAVERALAIDPQNARAYVLLTRIDVAQDGDVAAATRVLDNMAPGTPLNAEVAQLRIQLLLYRRDFGAARALAAKYADEFTSGEAAVLIAMCRANVEWLAGKQDAARAIYRKTIQPLTTEPGFDDSVPAHLQLGLAYARLGEGEAALKQNQTAAALVRKSHHVNWGDQVRRLNLAKIQLALGNAQAAIDVLARFFAQYGSSTWLSPSILRLDPTLDPVRHDPRFRALLKKYASYKPAVIPVARRSQSDTPPGADTP